MLTGNVSYSRWNDTATLQEMRAEEMPQQPPAWKFLGRCWSGDPTKRPPAVHVSNTFSQFRSLPQAVTGCEGLGIEELLGTSKLKVQSIKISLNKWALQFSVKLKYGSKEYTSLSFAMI